MAMGGNKEEDEVDSSRRRVWESPYVRGEDGEFEPIQAKDKSKPEKTVGVRTFGDSVQKGHMKSPGDIVGIGKMEHEVAKLRSELRNKSAVQLKEAVARQAKLLENKALVSRLPDKGEKCRYFLFHWFAHCEVDFLQVKLDRDEAAVVREEEGGGVGDGDGEVEDQHGEDGVEEPAPARQ